MIKGINKLLLLPLFILGLILFPVLIIAQNVTLTLDHDRATIGDFIKARLTVQGADPETVKWPAIEDKIGDFYLIKADTLGKTKSDEFGGATLEYTIAAYDTGSFSLGELTFEVNGSPVSVEGGSVQIQSVLKAPGDTLFAPLKPQAEVPWTLADVLKIAWPWAAGLVAAILLYILLRWWLKWRKGGSEEEYVEPPVPPYDEAIEALREFRLDNPFGRGDIKSHVTGLTTIVKRLLERVHEEPVQEMTTYEVNRWLMETHIHCDEDYLRQMLNQADTVKFAKGIITADIADQHVNMTAEIIEAYKPENMIQEVEIPTESEAAQEETEQLQINESASEIKTEESEAVLSADYEEKLLADSEKAASDNSLPEGWEKYTPGNSQKEENK